MSRQLCSKCKRPLKTCCCELFLSINNQISIIILQHPNESKQSKGSVTLLANSLKLCKVIQGENFTNNSELQKIISQYRDHIYLLYPEKNTSRTIDKENIINLTKHVKCLILLDATWKKAYRMYQLSANLQVLPKLQLPKGLPSHYSIRKTRVDNGLSTLEACCYALSLLESDHINYRPLLDNFICFNQLLLSFRPKT